MKTKNILFVCRYNRFRSRVAEAYFKKINKKKNIKIKSAGLIKGNPLNPKTVSIIKKLGLDTYGKPQGLSSKLMAWQNVTIIVANDVPPQVFDRNKEYGKRVIVWKIKDIKEEKNLQIKKVVKSIMKKVDKLVKNQEAK